MFRVILAGLATAAFIAVVSPGCSPGAQCAAGGGICVGASNQSGAACTPAPQTSQDCAPENSACCIPGATCGAAGGTCVEAYSLYQCTKAAQASQDCAPGPIAIACCLSFDAGTLDAGNE